MATEEIKNKYQIQREKAAADLAEIKNIISLIDKKDQQIKEKCDFLQTLVDSLPTPIYVKDRELKYKMCNDALSILMGVNRENIIGKTLTEIYSDNDESKFMYKKDMELLENGGTQSFDYEIAGIGKRPQILNFNRSIFRDENRQIAGIIGSCFDITDRVKKEKELRVEREKFYNAFDKSPIPKVITEYGTGLILEINETALEMFGFTREEIKDKTVFDLRTNSGRSLIKDYLNFTQEFFLSQLDKDKTGRIKSIDMIIYTKTDQEKVVALSASKYRVNGGHCVLSILKDITDRVLAEQKITKVKEEWEETFNVVPELIAILDNDHTIVRVNKSFADRFNNSSDYFIGKKCYDIVHNNNTVPEECPHAQLLVDGKQHIQEGYDDVLKGYFIVTCSPIFNDNKELIGSVHSMIDITERKETENKLKEISEQYEAAIELSNDAVAIVQDGKHVFVNKRFLDIFGINSFEDIIGKEYVNVYHNDIEFVRDINRRRTEGLRVPSKYEFRGVKLGDRRSMCIEVSAAKITYKGKIATLSYLRDVTERKRYEQFQNLPLSTLDTIPEMVCRHDSNFKFTYSNETYCKFIGKTREELETMTLFDFVPPEEVERLKDYLASFSVNKTSSSIVNKVILYSGEIVYIYWINRAFFDTKNQLIELQSIGRVSEIFNLEKKDKENDNS